MTKRKLKGVAIILIPAITLLGVILIVIYQNNKIKDLVSEIKPSSSPVTTASPSSTPTAIPTAVKAQTPTPVPTATPIPTPVPQSFDIEEALMRKTLAGFEMYIGGRNTAGALTFFTPPISQSAKEKLNSIRATNLPFDLSSWSFVVDHTGKLSVDTIKNGYRARITETRTNGSAPIIVGVELVRSSNAENGFMIDRYYTSQYLYQNNLGEEIKYQGFGL